jgi:hypothetical protein
MALTNSEKVCWWQLKGDEATQFAHLLAKITVQVHLAASNSNGSPKHNTDLFGHLGFKVNDEVL